LAAVQDQLSHVAGERGRATIAAKAEVKRQTAGRDGSDVCVTALTYAIAPALWPSSSDAHGEDFKARSRVLARVDVTVRASVSQDRKHAGIIPGPQLIAMLAAAGIARPDQSPVGAASGGIEDDEACEDGGERQRIPKNIVDTVKAHDRQAVHNASFV